MNFNSTSSASPLGADSLATNAAVEVASLDSVADGLVRDATHNARGGRKRYDHGELASAVIGELRRGGDATGLQEAIAAKLPAGEQHKLADQVNNHLRRLERTDDVLAARAGDSPGPGVRQVEAETVAILETATKSRTVGHRRNGPTTTQYLDTNELSYQLDRLSQRNPALAASVKVQLEQTLTNAQITAVERTFSGGATPAEDASLAVAHPREGGEGALQKGANMGMAVAEVLPGDQDFGRYEMENRAQRGGGVILEGASYATGGPTAARLGAKGLSGARALAASQAVRTGAGVGGTISYGASVEAQRREGVPLTEALTSERSGKAALVGTVTGAMPAAGLGIRGTAAGGAMVAGATELYADDFAGRDLDYGGAAEAAINNGAAAGVGVAGGKVIEGIASVGATGARLTGTIRDVLMGQAPSAAIKETARAGLADVSENASVEAGRQLVGGVVTGQATLTPPSEVIADQIAPGSDRAE